MITPPLVTFFIFYFTTAKAKAVLEWVIRTSLREEHLLPCVTMAVFSLPIWFHGTLFFVEIVFSYPGLGSLLYKSLLTRDYPLMAGIL